MIFLLNLIKIEIKRMLRFLPHIMVGALALCFIIGIISFSASKLLYEEKNKNKVNIALSMPKDENSSKLMISILKDMKSIKENCNFIEVNNEEAAYEMVENGDAYGAIIIPKHFVKDILDGTNTPATVVLPDKSSIEAMLIKDLIDAGTKSLASAQAGIYSIAYEYEGIFNERLTKELQDDINIKYFDHTLARESYFKHKVISATGDLTVFQYYISSGIVLFMLLLGMGFSKALSPNNNAFYEKLKPYGISKGIIILNRIISIFVVYIIISFIIFGIYAAIANYFELEILNFKIRDYILFLLVMLCTASFIVSIFTVGESQISGVLLLFIITIAMNYISGGFIPTVFLPKAIQSLAPYMLTNILAKQVGNIFLEEVSIKGFFSIIGVTIGIYIITIIIITVKDKVKIIIENKAFYDLKKQIIKIKWGKR